MSPGLETAIAAAISESAGNKFEIRERRHAGGGCINEAIILSDERRTYFVKLNSAAATDMFAAEAEALEALLQTRTIKVPRPIAFGQAESRAYLILEAVRFGHGKTENWQLMGRQLAELHHHCTHQFGWHRDNTIGSTPQSNQPTEDWATFFREQRLRPQFDLTRKNGFQFSGSDALLDAVDTLLHDHHPKASLLHGDLWSGNAGFTHDGTPVIYDPASYYGDRETDLAFSEFFGGFPAAFYTGYESVWPLEPGYTQRKVLYNLYHVLNHANLFGSSYALQAQSMIHRLLS